MMGIAALREGIAHTRRYWGLLALVFAVNVAGALCLAAPQAWGLAATFGRRPALRQAADGLDAWMVVETLMSSFSDMTLGLTDSPPTRWLGLTGLWALGVLLLLPLVAWLPANFLYGGLVLTYTEAPAPFRWRRFLWGSWHWFGAFLFLAGVQGAIVLLIGLPLAIAAWAASLSIGRWLGWLLTAALLLAGICWTAWVELTRVAAVVGVNGAPTRRIFRAMRQAARFMARHFRAVAVLYGAAFVLLGAVHALYRWALCPYLPLDQWLLVLVVQQMFILARLWVRLMRTAGGVVLYQVTRGDDNAA